MMKLGSTRKRRQFHAHKLKKFKAKSFAGGLKKFVQFL